MIQGKKGSSTLYRVPWSLKWHDSSIVIYGRILENHNQGQGPERETEKKKKKIPTTTRAGPRKHLADATPWRFRAAKGNSCKNILWGICFHRVASGTSLNNIQYTVAVLRKV